MLYVRESMGKSIYLYELNNYENDLLSILRSHIDGNCTIIVTVVVRVTRLLAHELSNLVNLSFSNRA